MNGFRRNLDAQRDSRPDSDEWLAANRRFHVGIAKAAHNRPLLHFGAELTKELAILTGENPGTLGDAMDPTNELDEHQVIIRAIESRDSASAQAAMERHLRSTNTKAKASGA